MDAEPQLFYKQLNRIIERKFHIVANLSESDFIDHYIMPLNELIIEGHIETDFRENRIPLLIVVPHNIVPLSYQLDSLRKIIDEKHLEYIIKPEWFENVKGVSTPDKPYLLLDVETGYAMKNITPKKCVETFNSEGKFALTIDEGLSLITHFPEVLASHWIDLPGSVLIHKLAGQDAMRRGMQTALPPGFGLETFVPAFYYKYYNSLRLYYVSQSLETPYSGSASCARRSF